MKILHCSDIHLGRKIVGGVGMFSEYRFNDYFVAFEFIVDYAIENNIDIFVIAGDLFDKKELNPEVLSRTEKILNKLKDYNIKCLVIEGNHDNITYGKEKDSWINYLQSRFLIQRLMYDLSEVGEIIFNPLIVDNVHFWGLGYPGSLVDEVIDNFSNHIVPQDGIINYVVVHSGIKSSELINGTVNTSSIDKLIGRVDYIAGGHLHSYSHYPGKDPVFFVPGSSEMWDLDEFRQKKGFIVFDTSDKSKTFVPVKNRAKSVHSVSILSDNYENANHELINSLVDIELENSPICYLLVKLLNTLEIDYAKAEEVLYQKGAIKVITKIENKYSESLEFVSLEGTESDIEKEVISSWSKFSEYQSETHSLLQSMKMLHNENLQTDFFETLDIFLDKMIGIEEIDS